MHEKQEDAFAKTIRREDWQAISYSDVLAAKRQNPAGRKDRNADRAFLADTRWYAAARGKARQTFNQEGSQAIGRPLT